MEKDEKRKLVQSDQHESERTVQWEIQKNDGGAAQSEAQKKALGTGNVQNEVEEIQHSGAAQSEAQKKALGTGNAQSEAEEEIQDSGEAQSEVQKKALGTGNTQKKEAADEYREIKLRYYDELEKLYSSGKIGIDVREELFYVGTELLTEMYALGKRDAVAHAHWTVNEQTFECTCSNCRNRVDIGDAGDYCRYCGAVMVED